MTVAVLFPGQGAQQPGMGEAVARFRPDLLSALERALGPKPFDRFGEGTRAVQPAIFCASVVGWDAIQRSGVRADVSAGHSLGELAALVAADVLDAADALEIVVARGRLTGAAAAQSGSDGMVAILRGDMETVDAIAERSGVSVANDNSPRQVVLSGSRAGLQRATDESTELGLRAVPLDVEGAFHSPAMASAASEYRRVLDAATFRAPSIPVYSGVTAAPFVDFPRQLTESLTQRVRWRELLLNLHSEGVRTFVDAGPGKVLAGLVKHTLEDVEIRVLADFESVV
jgi:[acyl-carrier-protein] S-malonyltransferase